MLIPGIDDDDAHDDDDDDDDVVLAGRKEPNQILACRIYVR